MSDLTKLADALELTDITWQESKEREAARREAARILRAADAADVDKLAKDVRDARILACGAWSDVMDRGNVNAEKCRLAQVQEDKLCAAINALESALRVALAPIGWRPIETAPRDGTDVIVMYVHIETQIVHNAFFISEADDCEPEDVGWWTYTHSEVSRELLNDWRTPTHWMPLPASQPGAQEPKP